MKRKKPLRKKYTVANTHIVQQIKSENKMKTMLVGWRWTHPPVVEEALRSVMGLGGADALEEVVPGDGPLGVRLVAKLDAGGLEGTSRATPAMGAQLTPQ